MEDWKIKIAVLWSVFEFCIITVGIVGLSASGYAVETPEITLILAVTMLIPPIMSFLSLTLKDSINRWVNIIVPIVFVVLSPTGLIGVPAAYLASLLVVAIVEFVALVLIVWYAWKSKQKA